MTSILKGWLRKRRLHRKKEVIIKLREEKFHHQQMQDWLDYKIAEAEGELSSYEDARGNPAKINALPTLKQAGVVMRG